MNENSYVIYTHTSPEGKSYIGMTKHYEQRCKEHRNKNSGSTAFSVAIQHFGWDSFKHEILLENIPTESEARLLEKQMINAHNSIYPYGYNLVNLYSGEKERVSSNNGVLRLTNSKSIEAFKQAKLRFTSKHKRNITNGDFLNCLLNAYNTLEHSSNFITRTEYDLKMNEIAKFHKEVNEQLTILNSRLSEIEKPSRFNFNFAWET
jgi:hypothetical protein